MKGSILFTRAIHDHYDNIVKLIFNVCVCVCVCLNLKSRPVIPLKYSAVSIGGQEVVSVSYHNTE